MNECSLGKWLISGVEQGIAKISLEYLVLESKNGIRLLGLIKTIQEISIN